MNRFHVMPIKQDREGFDWKVQAPKKTRAFIAAQNTQNEADYRDKLPEFYKTEKEALYAAWQLAERYAPAQVIHHMRPIKPTEPNKWGPG